MTKSIRRLILTYILAILAILLCEKISFYLYPLVVIFLSHLVFTLVLLGHEGTHFLIHPNKRINTFVARYFCHFPFFISHSHYSFNHLMHHRFLGSPRDPDGSFYGKSFSSLGSWLFAEVVDFVSLKTVMNFLNYFTGIPIWIKSGLKSSYKNDYWQLILYWVGVIAIANYFSIGKELVLYVIIPILVALPWVNIVNSFQHLSLDKNRNVETTNVYFENKILQEFLFPVNINYHETHHADVQIPYYELADHPLSQQRKSFRDKAREVFQSKS